MVQESHPINPRGSFSVKRAILAMAYIGMAYIVMALGSFSVKRAILVMAYIVMALGSFSVKRAILVMAFIVMALGSFSVKRAINCCLRLGELDWHPGWGGWEKWHMKVLSMDRLAVSV